MHFVLLINYSTSVVKIYVHRSYGEATAHWHSRTLFIYSLINLFSKNASENRYSANLAYPDCKYN